MILEKTTNDISLISRMETKCTGCGACVNVCPQGAIRLAERSGYFLFPEIDSAKCNHCGLCLKKCPSAGPRPAPSRVTNEVAYGCYSKDEMERARSSSGGFFQALAKHILRHGGAVCGAAFTKDWHLEHVIITEEKDLPPLQRSKYVQSNPKMVYAQIKELIIKGRKVLFVGTPCQVAACKAVVGDHFDALLTCDILCHGVPPERLFLRHLEEITNGLVAEISDVHFRDKTAEGWNESHFVVSYGKKVYDVRQFSDPYYKAFAEGMSIRRSCGDCRYARFPRQGDFTIGDLWGVAEKNLRINDNRGVSAIVINTSKAIATFNTIKHEFEKVKAVPIKLISATNNLEWHSYPHPNMLRFHKALSEKGFTEPVHCLIGEYLDKDDGICVLNFHDGHSNYGSVLTAYALKEKILSIVGYSPIHIHLWSTLGGEPEAGDIIDFNREEIPATVLINSRERLDALNKHFRTFIVGPDVVWRDCGFTQDFHWFLFNFVKLSRNICSYAASFGFPYLANTGINDITQQSPSEGEILKRKRLMKRFSHISVREDSGVRLCREYFDVEAEHVLDAVFFHNAEDWSRLIGCSPEKLGKDVRYILNKSCSSPELIKAIEANPNSVTLREGTENYADRLMPDANGKLPMVTGVTVREWIKYIRDSDHFISDSFHGLCFAIIFRKQFIALKPSDYAGTERVDSLFRMLGIPHDRYAYTVEDYERILANPLDYSKIEPRLNEWIAKSEDYLKRVLADNKPNRVRDWLESVEMLAESAQPPPRVGLKRRMVRVIRGALRRLRDWCVITDEIRGDERRLGVLGITIFTIIRVPGRRRIKFLGIPIISIKR